MQEIFFLNALPQIFSESLVTILGTFGLLVILLLGFGLERIFEPATIIFFASKIHDHLRFLRLMPLW